MDERVLGDVPSEGSENGRRFGVYREHDSDLKMRSVSKSAALFVTAIAAVIAFSVLYPAMQYISKVNTKSSTSTTFEVDEISGLNIERVDTSRNCSVQIFSFGNDCSDQHNILEEKGTDSTSTQSNSTQKNVRRIDNFGSRNTKNISQEIVSINHEDLQIKRTGRSRWPLVTPYPYYKVPTRKPAVTVAYDDQDLYLQETNIFAVPYDSSNTVFPDVSNSRRNLTLTPPPYVFTPFPNFTSSYAQLTPYRVPQNNSNFYKVMKYLNRNIASERNSSEEQLKNVNSVKNTLMKVKGTYVIPLDRRRPGEIILSSNSENAEEARPFFNGHAYVSDPFTKYRPKHPSDINKLIPVKSSVNLGPRFRKPVSFVPATSVAVDISRPISSATKDSPSGASHTIAIFHPPIVMPQNPPVLSKPTAELPKDQPLSVTLDIYPHTVDSETDNSSESSSTAGRERGRLNPKWKPKATERPKWRPQAHRQPALSSDSQSSTRENHMIVHLNLFPNNRKPYSLIRRNRTDTTNAPKTLLLTGDKFMKRKGLADHETQIEEDTETTTACTNTASESDEPEFSALHSEQTEEKVLTAVTTVDSTTHGNSNNSNSSENSDDNGSGLSVMTISELEAMSAENATDSVEDFTVLEKVDNNNRDTKRNSTNKI